MSNWCLLSFFLKKETSSNQYENMLYMSPSSRDHTGSLVLSFIPLPWCPRHHQGNMQLIYYVNESYFGVKKRRDSQKLKCIKWFSILKRRSWMFSKQKHKVPQTVGVNSHGGRRDVCCDVEVRQPQVLDNTHTTLLWLNDYLRCADCGSGTTNPHLDLFALEDGAQAGVKGSSRKHGGHWVGQVQDLLKVRGHILRMKQGEWRKVFPQRFS